MPIFDQGYQHWEGQLSGHAWRWVAIARRGVKSQLTAKWGRIIRLALLMSLSPALALGGFLAIWGLFERNAGDFKEYLRFLPSAVLDDPTSFRGTIWTLAFDLFLKCETFAALLIVLIVGPNLISQDMRFNAMPLYLSRPLNRLDYFAGKLGTIGAFLAMAMIVPAVLSYIVGVAFSPGFGVIVDTYRTLLASLAYGALAVLVFGLFMLAISSLSKNSRNVAAIWIGIWLLGSVSASILIGLEMKWGPTVLFTRDVERIGEVLLDADGAWKPLGEAQAKEFARMMGPFAPPPPPQKTPVWLAQDFPWPWAAYVLIGLLGFSTLTLTSRVKSLDRLR